MYLFAAFRHILRSQHCSVRTGLVTVCFDTHTAGDLHDGLAARKVSDVHEGVIERGEDVGDAKHILSYSLY